MWPVGLEAHPEPMHPYQHITLAQNHMADLQTAAQRQRLVRRARRLRRPAPTTPERRQ
jgi:hypothetical protein